MPETAKRTHSDHYGGHDGPNDQITREQATAMIARAMKRTGLEVELTDTEIIEILSRYTDSTNVSDYAKKESLFSLS